MIWSLQYWNYIWMASCQDAATKHIVTTSALQIMVIILTNHKEPSTLQLKASTIVYCWYLFHIFQGCAEFENWVTELDNIKISTSAVINCISWSTLF